MENNDIRVVIGSFVLAVGIISIPALCALSFALNWYQLFKVLLTLFTAGELIICTVSLVYSYN